MAEQSDGVTYKPELRQHPSDSSSSDAAAAFTTPPLFGGGSFTPPNDQGAKQLEHLLADISKQALEAQLSFLDGQPSQIMVVLGRLQQNLTQVVALVAKDEKVLVAHASVAQQHLKQHAAAARTFEDLPSFSQRWSLIALLLDVDPQQWSAAPASGSGDLGQAIDNTTAATTTTAVPPMGLPPAATMLPPPPQLPYDDKGKRTFGRVDTDYSMHSSSDFSMSDSAPPLALPQTRSSKLEQSLVVFLSNVCRDVHYSDGQGRALHQVLASRKSQVSLPTYSTTYKFRIEAFTQAFYEHVQQRNDGGDGGDDGDDFDVREIRAFLRSTRYIARFNDAGFREKSKGSYVWRVDASKDEHDRFTFRAFERMIIAPSQPAAYHGAKWEWRVQLWDPHVPAAELDAVFTASDLPSWLTWKDGGKTAHLYGMPDASSASTRFSVTAHFTNDDGQHESTSVTVDLEVKSPSMKRASSSRSTRGEVSSSSGAEEQSSHTTTMHTSEQDQRILIRNLMLLQQQKAATMSLSLPPAARRRKRSMDDDDDEG